LKRILVDSVRQPRPASGHRNQCGIAIKAQHRQDLTAGRAIIRETNDDQVRPHALDLRVGVGHRLDEHDIVLIADEQFRVEFLNDPEKTLVALCERGFELSKTEIAALVNTDRTLWARTADAIDPRLQKASLKNEVRV